MYILNNFIHYFSCTYMPLKICDNIFLIILITTLPKKKEEKKGLLNAIKTWMGTLLKHFLYLLYNDISPVFVQCKT